MATDGDGSTGTTDGQADSPVGGPATGTVRPDPTQLKALTHPVRLRLLGLLRADGPATATGMAARLGLNSGATSYHLRQLAEHGFVVEDTSRGNQRERWWRAAHRFTSVDHGHDDVTRDTADAFHSAVVHRYHEAAVAASEERTTLPDHWREVHVNSDRLLRLTPQQARGLRDRLFALLAEFDDEFPTADSTPEPGSRAVQVQVALFPLAGQTDAP